VFSTRDFVRAGPVLCILDCKLLNLILIHNKFSPIIVPKVFFFATHYKGIKMAHLPYLGKKAVENTHCIGIFPQENPPTPITVF
jgi:hypothetical protein